MPASVRSKPSPSGPSSRTRSASGLRPPGFGGSVGSCSRQRSQPALARWTTRCSPSAPLSTDPLSPDPLSTNPLSRNPMSRNFPCRTTGPTVRPASAVTGGS